jgi:hypothetical protein
MNMFIKNRHKLGREFSPNLPVVGLWPKIPLKKAGILIDPPMSDPIPIGDPPALNKAA